MFSSLPSVETHESIVPVQLPTGCSVTKVEHYFLASIDAKLLKVLLNSWRVPLSKIQISTVALLRSEGINN